MKIIKQKYIFLLFICILFFSCSKNTDIVGKWDNDDRSIEFTSNDCFRIEFKKPVQIKSFSGTYYQKKNIVVLVFEEYETSDGVTGFTDETDLADYKEAMEVSVLDSNQLCTKIIVSGKEYLYTRI